MAWRPYENLIDGVLDNTVHGKVTGYIRFYKGGESPLTVRLDLKGDFHEDIRGCAIKLKNPEPQDRNATLERSGSYMNGFSELQQGEVGDITAGLSVNGKHPYVGYPYIEWLSEENGRVVLELEPSQVEIIKRSPVKLLTTEEQAETELRRKQTMIEHMKKMARKISKRGGFGFIVGVGISSNAESDQNEL